MKKSLFGFLVLWLLLSATSCGLLRKNDAIHRNETLEAANQKAAEEEYQKAIKSHYKMQSDATQKLWKNARRKNKKYLRQMHHKESWFRKIFHGK